MSIPKSHVMSDDTRLALLEQSIEHLDQTLLRIDGRLDKLEERQISNFKWIMGTIVTLFSGLYATFIAGMVAKMCHWI